MTEQEERTHTLQELSSICLPLAELSESLAAVIPEREQDFIQLGQDLQHITSLIRELTILATELNEQASGTAVQAAMGELSGQLEQIENFWDPSVYASIDQELGGIETTIGALQSQLDQFRRIVRHLKALKMTTRIESARLGGRGTEFSTLADDVEKLANKIVTDARQIEESSNNLNEFVASVRFRTREMARMFENCAVHVSGKLGESISTLHNLVEKSKDGAIKLEWRMQEVSEKSGQIVASMQFHDITRQQVEHVNEAFEDIVSMLREKGTEEADGPGEIAAWINDVCGLQVHQIEHARTKFLEEVDQILTNLEGVADSVGFLCADVAETIGMDKGSGRSSLSVIAETMDEIAGCMKESSLHGTNIGKTMDEFAAKVSDMSSFVSEIEGVGSEIELISLNASVKAAHTGDDGAALGVIASAIQVLSMDARRHTGEVIPLLQDLSHASQKLQEITGKTMDDSRVQSMLERHGRAMTELNTINTSMGDLLERIVNLGIGLENDVTTIRGRVSFHEEVNQRLGELQDGVQGIVDKLQEHLPEETVQVKSERLQRMYERYTMESERLIHMSMNGEVEQDTDDGVELFGDEESEFGENVELF